MKNTTIMRLMFFAVSLIGCEESTLAESTEFDETIQAIIVDVSFGDIAMSEDASRSSTLVNVSISCRTVVPDYRIVVEGKTLVFELDAGIDASACRGAFEIIVPSAIDGILKTAAGDITVQDIEGDLSLATFDGDVVISNVLGNTQVAVVSGDIRGNGLSSEQGVYTAGAGDVTLSYISRPAFVDVDIMRGDASLFVPFSAYRVDAIVAAGEVDVSGITVATDAARALALAVDAGNISVLGN